MGELDQWLNRIHCGDAIELMQKLPPESVNLIVTSPPYNLGNSSGNGMKDGRGSLWKRARLRDGYETTDDNMPHEEYVKWQRACLTAMLRVLKPDGAIFYNHKCRVQDGLWQARSDILDGFPLRQELIWKRKGGMNFNLNQVLVNFEFVYVIARKPFRYKPKEDGVVYGEDNWCYSLGAVWDICQDKDNDHPAPFPVKLAKRCIEITTAKVVLDPFMGSGSTAIAAEELGRQWIGFDESENCVTQATARVASARLSRELERLVATTVNTVIGARDGGTIAPADASAIMLALQGGRPRLPSKSPRSASSARGVVQDYAASLHDQIRAFTSRFPKKQRRGAHAAVLDSLREEYVRRLRNSSAPPEPKDQATQKIATSTVSELPSVLKAVESKIAATEVKHGQPLSA